MPLGPVQGGAELESVERPPPGRMALGAETPRVGDGLERATGRPGGGAAGVNGGPPGHGARVEAAASRASRRRDGLAPRLSAVGSRGPLLHLLR
jgi:hypothetical protein